jgi:hypothetical protein
VNGGEPAFAGFGDEPWPPLQFCVEVLDDDRLPDPIAVEARPMVVLEQEELEGARLLAGGSHQLEGSSRVGEQDARFGGIDQLPRHVVAPALAVVPS